MYDKYVAGQPKAEGQHQTDGRMTFCDLHVTVARSAQGPTPQIGSVISRNDTLISASSAYNIPLRKPFRLLHHYRTGRKTFRAFYDLLYASYGDWTVLLDITCYHHNSSKRRIYQTLTTATRKQIWQSTVSECSAMLSSPRRHSTSHLSSPCLLIPVISSAG